MAWNDPITNIPNTEYRMANKKRKERNLYVIKGKYKENREIGDK